MTKIKLTYIQIRTALPILKGLQNEPMKATTSLIVARQGRILSGHATDSEEVRVGLMRKYADKDAEGEPIQIPMLDGEGRPIGRQLQYQIEDQEPLNMEWTEALMQEVEVEIPLLPVADLDSSSIELSPVEMAAIEPLLLEE